MTDNRLSKVRTEIERRYNEYMAKDSELAAIRADECLDILSFIDSMQEEPVSEEMEQAAITAADEDMQGRQIMEESNENRQLYSRIFRRGFKAGTKWQKEQMMKDAVDCMVCRDGYISLLQYNRPAFANVLDKYKDNDKVKLLIIKEENIWKQKKEQ